MKRIAYILLAGLATTGLHAQSVYDISNLSVQDLTGTARYVGMGGAMNALGADISTINGNPAGIGLYRHSNAAITGSILGQPDAVSYGDQGRVRGSLDQAGFVYSLATKSSKVSFVNFGFNYNKSKNFKNFFDTDWIDAQGQTQVNLLANHLSNAAIGYPVVGDKADFRDYNSIISNGALDLGLLGFETDVDGKCTNVTAYRNADAYRLRRATWGYVSEFSFNVAFNVQDRIYAGATFGCYDIRHGSQAYYEEYLQYPNHEQMRPELSYGAMERSEISGTGFDMKFGVIVRPIEDNSFRIGLAIHTPRYLSLNQDKSLVMDGYEEEIIDHGPGIPAEVNGNAFDTKEPYVTGSYDYDIRTPWRLQFSMAGTVSNWLALDGEYEFTGMRNTRISYPSDNYYNRDAWHNSRTDEFVADEIKYCLNNQHAIRLGAEARFAENFYARLGYNFISAPHKDKASLYLAAEGGEVPPVTYFATSTDYANMGATNRFTLGLGYKGRRVSADIAYLVQRQNATVYPFDGGVGTDISLVRQAAMATIGIHF